MIRSAAGMHPAKFPSSPGTLYQNDVKCSAFDMEMIFHSQANTTHFHKKGCALGLILKVRVFGTRKWPILLMFFARGFAPGRLLFSVVAWRFCILQRAYFLK